ncbi:(2Fe-2S)-binding protein [Aliarcobacter lanthieri]|uniref:(2Fe-2S)-binding protein n=1 Tax=Aliarcobacter lanthieri TaxID=1355374 RepID=UPI003AAE73C1
MNYTIINSKRYELKDIASDTPILWVLRDYLNLTGTKFGCGVAVCGACTILLENNAIRSCQTPISEAFGKNITTIENKDDKEINLLRKWWIEEDVVQCGYCQAGQIMNASWLLKNNKQITQQDIVDNMNGNICRCGTYNKIQSAIFKAAKEIR